MEPILDSFSQSPLIRYIYENFPVQQENLSDHTAVNIPHYRRKHNMNCISNNNIISVFTKPHLSYIPSFGTGYMTDATRIRINYYNDGEIMDFSLPNNGLINSMMLKINFSRDYNAVPTVTTDADRFNSGGITHNPFPFHCLDHRTFDVANMNVNKSAIASPNVNIGGCPVSNAYHDLNVVRLVNRIELISEENKLVETIFPETIVHKTLSECSYESRIQWRKMMNGISNVYSTVSPASPYQACSPTELSKISSKNVTMHLPIPFSFFKTFSQSIDVLKMKKLKVRVYTHNKGVTYYDSAAAAKTEKLIYSMICTALEFQSETHALIRELKFKKSQFIGTSFHSQLPFISKSRDVITISTPVVSESTGASFSFNLSTFPCVVKNMYIVAYPGRGANSCNISGAGNSVAYNSNEMIPQGLGKIIPNKIEIVSNDQTLYSFDYPDLYDLNNKNTFSNGYSNESSFPDLFGTIESEVIAFTPISKTCSVNNCVFKIPFSHDTNKNYSGGIPFYATDSTSILNVSFSYAGVFSASAAGAIGSSIAQSAFTDVVPDMNSIKLLIEYYYIYEIGDDGSIVRLMDM